MQSITRAMLTAAVLPLIGIFSPSQAQENPADFYRGKQVDLVIASTVGGGYDLLARVIADYMPKHIPGQPRIVPKNVVGAGGLAAANFIYNTAAKDGTAFATVQNPIPFMPLFGEPQARFDALKMNYVGSANSEVEVAFVWHTSKIQNLDDALRMESTMATTGGGATSAFLAAALNTFIGTKFKIITGYPGTAEVNLAVERGEVDGHPSIFWTTLKATKPQWLADHQIRLLAQLALKKHPDLPDVPLAIDYAKTPEDREALELIFAAQLPGRPYIAPPDMPHSRLKVLQDAFMATMKDPEFLAQAKKRDLEIQAMPGPEVQAFISKTYQTPKAIVDRVNAVRTMYQ
jgi:tripartite-type tricarboxylate transporter receptor subunit TctC